MRKSPIVVNQATRYVKGGRGATGLDEADPGGCWVRDHLDLDEQSHISLAHLSRGNGESEARGTLVVEEFPTHQHRFYASASRLLP